MENNRQRDRDARYLLFAQKKLIVYRGIPLIGKYRGVCTSSETGLSRWAKEGEGEKNLFFPEFRVWIRYLAMVQ